MSKNIGTGKNQKGFSVIFTVVIGVVVLAGVVGVLMVANNNKSKTPADLTTNTKSVTEKNTKSAPIADSGTQGQVTPSKNLPQYPGSRITDSTTSAEGSSLDMEMESSMDANALSVKVLTYYKQELPKLGWKIGVREGAYSETPGLLLFYNDKYDGTLGAIGVSDTKIIISIATNPPYLVR